MNELEMIRELLPDAAAPAPLTIRTAEDMLAAEIAKDRRPARRRRMVIGLGVVAVGAAAASVLAMLPGGTEPKRPVVPTHRTDAFLLAAAKAELLPTGKYWHSDQVNGQAYVVKGKSGSTYAIFGTGSESFEWTAAKVGGGNLFYGRDLPFQPQTPSDRAAWRAAGSPRTLKVWANDHYDTIVSKPGPWQADKPQAGPGGGFGLEGPNGPMTVDQLQNLPTDPAQLAKVVFPAGKAVGKTDGNAVDPAHRLMRIGDLLMNTPLPPKVQAALMRLAAAQPGVRRIGTVVDPLGRTGVALAGPWGREYINSPEQDYGSDELLIVDATTGAFLADQMVLTRPGGLYKAQRPGFVINYWLLRSSGWTNNKPVPPRSLPY